MSFEVLFNRIGVILAGVDFSAKQFYFCQIDSNGKAVLPTGAGVEPAGIVQNNPVVDEPVDLTTLHGSISKVIAGETIAQGDAIATAADGRAKVADASEFVAGIALVGGAAGTAIPVLTGFGNGVNQPVPHGGMLLSQVTGIDLKAVAATDLFTVPTGKKLWATHVRLFITAVDTFTVAAVVRLLAEATEIVANTTLTGLNAVNEAWEFVVSGLNPVVAAAQDVKLDVTTGATATTLTATAQVYGILVDA